MRAMESNLRGFRSEFAIKVPDSDLNPRKFDSIARMDAYLADHM